MSKKYHVLFYNVLRQGQSIYNGVFGDRVHEKAHIKMTLFQEDMETPVNNEFIQSLKQQKNLKLCLFIHGVFDDVRTWKSEETENFGEALKKRFNYISLYLRYNSGEHISTNGKKVSLLLEELCNHLGKSLKEIIIIGHSMGGLVTRSACYYGKDLNWVKKVRRCFYLGTPHLGAPLEFFGNLANWILKVIPNIPTRLLNKVFKLRSAGLKDLRYGYIVDEDWMGKDPDALFSGKRKITPLARGIEHYAIVGIISKKKENFMVNLLGDTMVPVDSGFGRSIIKKNNLHFKNENTAKIEGVGHIGLLTSEKVLNQLCLWVADGKP